MPKLRLGFAIGLGFVAGGFVVVFQALNLATRLEPLQGAEPGQKVDVILMLYQGAAVGFIAVVLGVLVTVLTFAKWWQSLAYSEKINR